MPFPCFRAPPSSAALMPPSPSASRRLICGLLHHRPIGDLLGHLIPTDATTPVHIGRRKLSGVHLHLRDFLCWGPGTPHEPASNCLHLVRLNLPVLVGIQALERRLEVGLHVVSRSGQGCACLALRLRELFRGDPPVSVRINRTPHRLEDLGVGQRQPISEQNCNSTNAFLHAERPIPVLVKVQNDLLGLSMDRLQIGIYRLRRKRVNSSKVEPLDLTIFLRALSCRGTVHHVHIFPDAPRGAHVLDRRQGLFF
mmetsp:Transcript_115312/g.264844  ORF Transcript_115312/g.264844 Transcript_115312/m.264844 type:complete len:254 (+) Transcript_115312:530-1291(+)